MAATGHDDAPSPTVPFFLVTATVAIAFLPWLSSYVSVIVTALQQVNSAEFLWPLLIIFGISFISAYHDWVNPTTSRNDQLVHTQSTCRNLHYPTWKGGSSDDYSIFGHSNQQYSHHDNSNCGVGLFILLVFALLLIFGR